jgi:hypothetical protein
MKPALLFLFILLLNTPAKEEKPPVYHERVIWTEPGYGDDAMTCSLEFWTQSKGMKQCLLRCQVQDNLGEVWDTTHTDSDWMRAQIDLAVAIKVKGATRPQILVQRQRSSWGDYVLYDVENSSLRKAFLISHRDWGCIQWITKNGELERFIVFDRWQTEGRPPEQPGKRWQERSEYLWNTKKAEWQQVKRQWQTYRSDVNKLNNPVFEKPSDCSFRFQRAKPTARRAKT